MRKKSKPFNQGFILLETILAFYLIHFAVFFFYSGSLNFLKQSEAQQEELQMYRVLYEEIASARKQGKSKESQWLQRGKNFYVEYQLEEQAYAQITRNGQTISIQQFQ
ncbi:hypothetical protein ACYSNO_06900 [Enterococcus sp. LJL98]